MKAEPAKVANEGEVLEKSKIRYPEKWVGS